MVNAGFSPKAIAKIMINYGISKCFAKLKIFLLYIIRYIIDYQVQR